MSQSLFENGAGEGLADAAPPRPVVADDDLGEDTPADGQSDELADRVSELEREITAERDKNLRLAAEFDNFRKRMVRQAIEAEGRGQADLVKAILDPLDDIARFAHVDPAVTDSVTLVEGVDMVEKKMAKSLRAAGLEVVNPLGERFDPTLHEAVATEPAAEPVDDGTVARVYQAGYTFKGQLLRPARVAVAQFPGSH